ncbi:hypothetical protein Vadar_032478 [Vaccinium darrowii]|uniref:Uncharacterized protein n=1 Tax=Vaccinium darrowii TaxID=229202 RepID=A0ACB7YSE2_9ERIC|nr:hypothetical protein Vadar_032478 [Vaccinium darrowii]
MFEEDNIGGMDKLLAVLGYKVKAADMPDVAQKLEQLEMVMDQEDRIFFPLRYGSLQLVDLSGKCRGNQDPSVEFERFSGFSEKYPDKGENLIH